jgi:hypothetical protein
MSWAAKRKLIYIIGICAFFLIVIGTPVAYHFLTIAPTCFDGTQNQGETSVDRGGPCVLLDQRTIQPYAILWARSFPVRGNLYNAVAYIQNPNEHAGVRQVHYRFTILDSQNQLITKRDGVASIMPGGTTPIFEAGLDAGNQVPAHTRFEFTEPLKWERTKNVASIVAVSNIETTDLSTAPRVNARAANGGYTDLSDLTFVAVAFDTTGNAFAASATALLRLPSGRSAEIVFTWPTPFSLKIARLDIIPVHVPAPDPPKSK